MLDNIDKVLGRMRQIERRIEGGPVGSSDFQRLMRSQNEAEQAKPNAGNLAEAKLNSMSSLNLMHMRELNPLGGSLSSAKDIVPLAQNNSISCGQTSVAMCINALTDKDWIDSDVNQKYGFELLNALNGETEQAGFEWRDGGEIEAGAWSLIDHKVNKEKLPVIVGLNGPEFSPSGRGHIVTILKTEGDTVTYADPADGTVKTTTKQAMNTAPLHPDGNFIFYSINHNQAGLLPPG